MQFEFFSWKNQTTFFLLKQTSSKGYDFTPAVFKKEEKSMFLTNANPEVIQSIIYPVIKYVLYKTWQLSLIKAILVFSVQF